MCYIGDNLLLYFVFTTPSPWAFAQRSAYHFLVHNHAFFVRLLRYLISTSGFDLIQINLRFQVLSDIIFFVMMQVPLPSSKKGSLQIFTPPLSVV